MRKKNQKIVCLKNKIIFFHFLGKELNIIDFINQKNKFFFQNNFDEKETKDFLKSKEKALMEIQLDEQRYNNN